MFYFELRFRFRKICITWFLFEQWLILRKTRNKCIIRVSSYLSTHKTLYNKISETLGNRNIYCKVDGKSGGRGTLYPA